MCSCEKVPPAAATTSGLLCGGLYLFEGQFAQNINHILMGAPNPFFVLWVMAIVIAAFVMWLGLRQNMYDHDPGYGLFGSIIGAACAYGLWNHIYPTYFWKSVLISVLAMCVGGVAMTLNSRRYYAKLGNAEPVPEPVIEYSRPDPVLLAALARTDELENLLGLTALRQAAVEQIEATGVVQRVTFEPVWEIPSPRMRVALHASDQ
jgi:hypothetical protein